MRYLFLFDGYKNTRWFWEIIVVFRKVFLIGIAVFFAGDPQVQTLLATILVVMALVLQLYFKPYEDAEVDSMETLGLSSAFLTFLLGQFLFVPSVVESENDSLAVSFVIVVINVSFYCKIFYSIGTALYIENFAPKKEAEPDHEKQENVDIAWNAMASLEIAGRSSSKPINRRPKLVARVISSAKTTDAMDIEMVSLDFDKQQAAQNQSGSDNEQSFNSYNSYSSYSSASNGDDFNGTNDFGAAAFDRPDYHDDIHNVFD